MAVESLCAFFEKDSNAKNVNAERQADGIYDLLSKNA